MTRPIYHITTRDAWERRELTGSYRHPSLDSDGFIHCSDESQLEATWRRIFGAEPGLVVLTIDVDRLTSELRYEEGEPGELFPHVYGPVNVDAVVGVREMGPYGG